MVTISTAKQIALSLPEVEEKSHFERPDFRVRKKVFAVLHASGNGMVIKLSPLEQSVFCAFDKDTIYPVPGAWGKKGWTFINLKKIRKGMLSDALTTAWKTVAPVKLLETYFPSV